MVIVEKLKQNKILLIIFVITLLLIVIGVTYSLYKILFVGKKEQVIDAGGLVFKYNEQSPGLNIGNDSILNDIEGKSQDDYFDFEVSLTSDKKTTINYIIAIDEDSVSTLTGDKVKIYLTDQNNNELVIPTRISELELDANKNNYKKLYNKQINQGENHLYRLRAWIDDSADLYIETSNDGTHTLEMPDVIYKFKINVYDTEKSHTAVEKLILLTNNKNESGLYTITHAADSTLQIGATEDITEYRYRGANPKNYVTFNNEVWRILGVFKADDGNGNIENRIKIIRNESIGNKYWNTDEVLSTSSYNNWVASTLRIELNGIYLTSLTNESQSMIESVKYYLGGYNDSFHSTQKMYYYERKASGSEYFYGTNPANWTGKVALMYASDYGYASANCETKSLYDYEENNSENDLRSCNDTNWLYNLKAYEWLLPQGSGNKRYAFYVHSTGRIGDYGSVNSNESSVRPTLYLKSNVKITGGSGTSSDPYTLGI